MSRRSDEIPGLALGVEDWKPASLEHLATQLRGKHGDDQVRRLRGVLTNLLNPKKPQFRQTLINEYNEERRETLRRERRVRTPNNTDEQRLRPVGRKPYQHSNPITQPRPGLPAKERKSDRATRYNKIIRICERLYLQYADAYFLAHAKEGDDTRTARSNLTNAARRLIKRHRVSRENTGVKPIPLEFLDVAPKMEEQLAEIANERAILDEWGAAIPLSDVALVCDLPVYSQARSLTVATLKGTSRDLEEASPLYSALASLSVHIRPHLHTVAENLEFESLGEAVTLVWSYLPPTWLATPNVPHPELDVNKSRDLIVDFLHAHPNAPKPKCKKCIGAGQCWRCAHREAAARGLYSRLEAAFPRALKE